MGLDVFELDGELLFEGVDLVGLVKQYLASDRARLVTREKVVEWITEVAFESCFVLHVDHDSVSIKADTNLDPKLLRRTEALIAFLVRNASSGSVVGDCSEGGIGPYEAGDRWVPLCSAHLMEFGEIVRSDW